MRIEMTVRIAIAVALATLMAGCSESRVDEPASESVTATPTAAGFRDDLQSGGQGPQMVAIPAGTFTMGCLSWDCGKYEKPTREVAVASFAMGVTEVTFEEWDLCVSKGGCANRPDYPGWDNGNRPVANVGWHDAQEYVAWLSRETGEAYRLPTEAEWEYAARAGTTTKYWWGDEVGVNRANCARCRSQWDGDGTAPVGSFDPNPWGLHDVHGNVEEWVEDCWNVDYEGAPTDGSAWLSGNCRARVLRGGSWMAASMQGTRHDSPWFVRAAFRIGVAVLVWRRGYTERSGGYRSKATGFRVARTLAP